MSLKFPIIILPQELSELCLQELTANKISYTIIAEKILKDPFLLLLSKKIYKRHIGAIELEASLASNGWPTLRNTLTSIYWQKKMTGEYVVGNSFNEIQDLLALEDRYKSHSSHGVSRIFLLGFYLKLWGLSQKKELVIPKSIDLILDLHPVRHAKLDWFIVALWHFIDFWGVELAIKKMQEVHGNFYKLMDSLSEDESSLMISNMLNYACSIHDMETVTAQKV